MNIFDLPNSAEAKIRYLDADYQVLSPGTFVRCAVTGKPIPLDELKYWSVKRQEAYIDVAASLKREMEFMRRG
ncbi:MAG: DUF2093 domain-containing protein [Oricola sp.]